VALEEGQSGQRAVDLHEAAAGAEGAQVDGRVAEALDQGIQEAGMRIGEVAEKAGVSVRALRYYEEKELLDSTRSSGGQRVYPDSAVERVRLIQLLYAAGLPSKTVREVLPTCMDGGTVGPELVARLTAERDRIDRQIADLTEVRGRLDGMIALAKAPGPVPLHAARGLFSRLMRATA
jgi:DNA-binding transcriptional MerR regulator